MFFSAAYWVWQIKRSASVQPNYFLLLWRLHSWPFRIASPGGMIEGGNQHQKSSEPWSGLPGALIVSESEGRQSGVPASGCD